MPYTRTQTTIALGYTSSASLTPTIAVITEGKALKSMVTTIRTSFRSGNCKDHTSSVLHTPTLYIVQYPSALVAVAFTSRFSFLVLLIQPVTARSGFLLHMYTGQAQDTSCLLPSTFSSGYLSTEAQRSTAAIYHSSRPWQLYYKPSNAEESPQPQER